MPALFPLGLIGITPAAANVEARSDIIIPDLVLRHAQGDWGDIDEHDREVNANALSHHGRLMSAYGEGPDRLYIITEADRSVTTVLCPSDY